MDFSAIRVQLEDRRSPLRVVLLTITLELFSIVFHVHARRHEVLRNEPHDALVRPHLGIQPSTATSHRRGAEVEENGFVLAACLSQYVVDVVPEFDLVFSLRSHRCSLLGDSIQEAEIEPRRSSAARSHLPRSAATS
jgi:hypothetical protein